MPILKLICIDGPHVQYLLSVGSFEFFTAKIDPFAVKRFGSKHDVSV